MKRAEKIKRANEALQASIPDDRDPEARESARREWGQIRKAAREAFLARADWISILNEYRENEGFYTSAERAKMCTAYADELTTSALK